MAQTYDSIGGDGRRTVWHGVDTTSDNAVIVETGDVSHLDTFTMMCSAGAFDVYVTLDGTNWTTASLSLSDLGATSTDPVIVGSANRLFGFAGVFRGVRVLQEITNVTDFTMVGRDSAR